MKSVRIISVFVIIICLCVLLFLNISSQHSVFVQNRIIDNVLNVDVDEYLGYIYIPRFNIKRLIKHGTDSYILDDLYVGLYESSALLDGTGLIILAGHDVPIVFSKLHNISIGDDVFIRGNGINRKFVVYDSVIVSEDNMSYFTNRDNELLLITCTDKKGYRLLVFLREVL